MFMICSKMNALAAPIDSCTLAPAPDAANPLLARRLAQLDRLAEAGLEIAEALASQAKGSGPQMVEGDVALAYARVSRAVRMAVMLQSRLSDEAERENAPQDPAQDHKARVKRIVGRILRTGYDGVRPDEYESCQREVAEYLDDDDAYGDVLSRPISELVAQVCEDLGLEPDWESLALEPWALREIESGEVGKPLAERVLPSEQGRTRGSWPLAKADTPAPAGRPIPPVPASWNRARTGPPERAAT
jgi:hypothetical protein